MKIRSIRKKWGGAGLIVLMLLGLPVIVPAGDGIQDSTPLQVTADVGNSCSLIAPPLKFGHIRTREDQNAKWLIWIKCTLGTHYKIAVGSGRFKENKGRRLGNGKGAHLGYRLGFSRSGGDDDWDEWGDNDFDNTYPPAPSVSGIASGGDDPLTVVGRIPGNFDIPPGSYGDTLRITLHY